MKIDMVQHGENTTSVGRWTWDECEEEGIKKEEWV